MTQPVDLTSAQEVKRLRRGVRILDVEGRKYVEKTAPMPLGLVGRARRHLFGSASFRHEVRYNLHLLNLEFSAFKYPKLVHHDEKRMLFEFVEGRHVVGLDEAQAMRLAAGLAEFQFGTPALRPLAYDSVVNVVRSNTGRFDPRRAQKASRHTGDHGLAARARAVATDIDQALGDLRVPAVAHRDLNTGNVLFADDGPYVLDFAGVDACTKWICNDVAWHAMPSDRYHIDAELIAAYCSELARREIDTVGGIRERLRYSMLTRIVFLLGYVEMEAVGERYMRFFDDIVSSPSAFREWTDGVMQTRSAWHA